jgi:hypothetical protein
VFPCCAYSCNFLCVGVGALNYALHAAERE